VTDEATRALSEILEDAGSADDQALRLVAEEDGRYSFALDEPRDGDQVVADGERSVLLIADDLAASLDGIRLELTPGVDGGELRLAPAS
jgi:hypothetical protein